MVRDGVGACEDRGGLAVLAVRIGEEERFGRREAFVQPAALADEAAFDDRAVADDGAFGGDGVVGFDIDADADSVAEGGVFEDRRAVDLHVVADADLADEARADDAAPAAHFAHLRGTFPGIFVDHLFKRRNGLPPVAVDGHYVGDLRRHRVEYLYRAAAAFVHRGDARTVAEGRAAAAFERRDALDERRFADAVVGHPRTDDAGAPGDFDAPFQVALVQLERFEIGSDQHFCPIFGRIAEGFECGDLRGGQFPE